MSWPHYCVVLICYLHAHWILFLQYYRPIYCFIPQNLGRPQVVVKRAQGRVMVCCPIQNAGTKKNPIVSASCHPLSLWYKGNVVPGLLSHFVYPTPGLSECCTIKSYSSCFLPSSLSLW
jgi:hypothetical protein